MIDADLKNGVPIACVRLVQDDNKCWTFTEVDVCGPRPLVKSNDLLFDLIRGCDLTRIERAYWLDLLSPDPKEPEADSVMEYTDFSDNFSPWGSDERKYVSKIFGVRFSGPVRKETLRPACFAMTAIAAESEGGWRRLSRVPIVAVETDAPDATGYVREARIVVKGSWVRDAVRGDESKFYRQRVRIEFEVRGDLILDCNGQAVDANSHGPSIVPTGNATPGGTLLSAFRVTRRTYQGADEID